MAKTEERPPKSFKSLELPDYILESLEEQGYMTPSEIQIESLIAHNKGRNHIIGQSPNGTGKTLAFLLICIPKICVLPHIQSVIICPTREICIQIYTYIKELTKYAKEGIAVGYAVGGTGVKENIRDLRGCQILVGTLGRLRDLVSRGSLSLSHTNTVVLDEADALFNGGFKVDLEYILDLTPPDIQFLAYSATFSTSLLSFIRHKYPGASTIKLCHDIPGVAGTQDMQGKRLSMETTHLPSISLANVKEFYVHVQHFPHTTLFQVKIQLLAHILNIIHFNQAIIFFNYKSQGEILANHLRLKGLFSVVIHGDQTMPQRIKTIEKMRNLHIRIILTSDLLARGIDLPGISLVINLSLPSNLSEYYHRIGRTGRYGSHGVGITFLSSSELNYLERESMIGITERSKIAPKYKLPSKIEKLPEDEELKEIMKKVKQDGNEGEEAVDILSDGEDDHISDNSDHSNHLEISQNISKENLDLKPLQYIQGVKSQNKQGNDRESIISPWKDTNHNFYNPSTFRYFQQAIPTSHQIILKGDLDSETNNLQEEENSQLVQEIYEGVNNQEFNAFRRKLNVLRGCEHCALLLHLLLQSIPINKFLPYSEGVQNIYNENNNISQLG